MKTKILAVIILGHSSSLFGATIQLPGRLVTAPSVRIAPTAFALNGLRTTTRGSFPSVVPLPILNTPIPAAPAPLVHSQISLQPSGSQAEPEARGTVLGSLNNAISLATPWGRIFDFSAGNFPGSNLPSAAAPLGGVGSSKNPISDAEVRQHLDEAGHMSSSWANNDMIESYFNANKDRLSPSQLQLLLSGLKESSAYTSSKSYSRSDTYYRMAAAYFKTAMLTPSEAVDIAAKASLSWHTNDLIEMYFTDAQMRLSWEDVKLLLAGLKESQARTFSKSYTRTATYYRMAASYFKTAQMTPSEAVEIAGKAFVPWHTNELIEGYFTDAQMRLSWEDVKLLLTCLKESEAYTSSKSYSRAATQDRIIRAWEKIAHRS